MSAGHTVKKTYVTIPNFWLLQWNFFNVLYQCGDYDNDVAAAALAAAAAADNNVSVQIGCFKWKLKYTFYKAVAITHGCQKHSFVSQNVDGVTTVLNQTINMVFHAY